MSGSDTASSDDGDSDGSDNAVSRLLRKQKIADGGAAAGPGSDDDETPTGPRSALLWFEAPQAAPGTQFGVYRAALPKTGRNKSRATDGEILAELKASQLAPTAAPSDRKWLLLMFGGGHFAGMIVSLVPKLVHVGKGKEKAREAMVIKSKTFHRYTTRRKQGGSQAAFGKANSIGAQIRMANEDALREEVRELLRDWSDEIAGCEAVFLRASKTNYKPFFDYEGAPLTRTDPRIRGYSFPTRRPTVKELLRSFDELTRVKVSHLTEDALAKMDADYLASIAPRPKPVIAPPKPAAPKQIVARMTKEEEVERDRWERLVDMVKKGKVDVLAAFLDKYGPELEQPTNDVWGALPPWMAEADKTPTLLHLASLSDQPEMVRYLLVDKRANPTLEACALPSQLAPPPAPGPEGRLAIEASAHVEPRKVRQAQTPYELAPSRATRNVFRIATNQFPDWWDWTVSGAKGARVPSGLDEDREETPKDIKAKERRNKLRQQLKERDAAREATAAQEREKEEREREERERREQQELIRTRGTAVKASGPQRLGGAPPQRMLDQRQQHAGEGLSDAQRARVMREQRARAAEARLGGGAAK